MIKVGDQVTVYDAASYPLPVRGTVTKTTKTTCDVRTADGSMWSGFKKQCHRLRPRKKPAQEERVECWVRRDDIALIPRFNSRRVIVSQCELVGEQNIHMVELREGERVVSRADLEKALDVSHALAKALGLEAP